MLTKIKKQHAWKGVLLAFAISGFGWLVVHHLWPREPSFEGKTLSTWLEDSNGYTYGEGGWNSEDPTTDHAIIEMGTNVIPSLLRLLQSKDSRAKVYLLNQEYVRVPAWLRLKPDYFVHRRAFLAFAALGPAGKPAIPGLAEIAFGPDADYTASARGIYNTSAASFAADSLAAIGAESLPPLIKALADNRPYVRASAADALGQMGAIAEPAVPTLIKLLKDADESVRRNAAAALGSIGERAATAVPALIETAKDKSSGVCALAVVSLGQIRSKPELAIPVLIEAIDDKDDYIKEVAIMALGHFGADARAALPKLISVRDDKEDKWRDQALAAVNSINGSLASGYPAK